MEKVLNRKLGEEVWVMNDNHAKKGFIGEITYYKVLNNINFETISEKERYKVFYSDGKFIDEYPSELVFSTRDELIKSL